MVIDPKSLESLTNNEREAVERITKKIDEELRKISREIGQTSDQQVTFTFNKF